VRVGLKPKQIKYLNSTAARLQSNEKEEMGFSGVQLHFRMQRPADLRGRG
jgi:hypothetical protein